MSAYGDNLSNQYSPFLATIFFLIFLLFCSALLRYDALFFYPLQ